MMMCLLDALHCYKLGQWFSQTPELIQTDTEYFWVFTHLCLTVAAESAAVVAWLMLAALASPSVLKQGVVSEVEGLSESLACEITKPVHSSL